MKRILIILIFASLSIAVSAQKYYSKTGHISFLSKAPLETIEATNQNAYVVLDAATGQFEWSVLIKGFQFEKALMQEHFNENYLESDKYPKALFKGQINNIQGMDLTKDGSYDVEAGGNLTIHGVTKPFRALGKIHVKNGQMNAVSSFDVAVADYNISIPGVVRDNIAKTVKVTVKADLEPLK